jgi:hypothetical protein
MRNIPGVHVDARQQSRIAKSPLLKLDGHLVYNVSAPALRKTGKPYRVVEL